MHFPVLLFGITNCHGLAQEQFFGSVAQERSMWVVRAAPDHLVVPKIASIGIKYCFQCFSSCQFTLTVSP